jgi:hypothetical protein
LGEKDRAKRQQKIGDEKRQDKKINHNFFLQFLPMFLLSFSPMKFYGGEFWAADGQWKKWKEL